MTLVAYLFVTTPRPTNLRDCLTTSLFSVRLCPGSSQYVSLRQVAPIARQAILVSEDASFYDHDGFDWFELRKSIEENLQEGGSGRGGSTISQQLAKNVYLNANRSIVRKLREALIVIQMEDWYSKDELLEKYLNVIEFAPNVYGIRAAASHYFSKHPSELSAVESAWLAFVLPSPKRYSISFQRRKLTPFARGQMRRIIDRLARFRHLTQEERQAALALIPNLFQEPTALPMPDENPEATDVMPEELIETEN
jgi:monofunctional biosynthetic peptidoglycan transglycosylase